MFRMSLVLVMLVVVAAVAGCGGEDTGLNTVPVTGTVTLNGSPVEGATVTFSPKDASGKAASAVTDSSGNFALQTMVAGDGAVPGSYGVMITKMDAAASSIPEDRSQMTPEQQQEMMRAMRGQGPSAPKSLLPQQYGAVETSGLTADVTEDGENNFPFDLKQ